jgi:uncharacterized DUF497 family protein
MDIEFELQGVRFVANREKAQRNPAKHQGVTFEHAAQAFFDPFLRVVDADRDEEARDAVVGMDASSRLLFVVHIQREDDRIRLISARKATREERNLYENY